MSVIDRYNYDDGSEKLKNDTFEREPFVVRFNSPSTSRHRVDKSRHPVLDKID